MHVSYLRFLMPLTVISFITVSPYTEATVIFFLPLKAYAVKESMLNCLLLKSTLSPLWVMFSCSCLCLLPIVWFGWACVLPLALLLVYHCAFFFINRHSLGWLA